MFTSNQIEEIRKKLQLGGTKDTQFPLVNSLKGNETIAIVQQGINKQLGLKTLLESVTKWSMSDFLNISKSSEDSYTLEEVLRLIAPINRKAGQVITFKDKMTGTWSIYQFKGESAEDWFNLDYWDDILVKVDNHFKGLVLNDCILNETYPKPMIGDFAFVGSTLSEAVIYTCYNHGHWHNTEEPAINVNEEVKAAIEDIFNNIENYPDILEVIGSSTPIYNVDYNNYTAEDFTKIKETIDKGGIITVSNINIFGLASNNVYHIKNVSDYGITLNTLVQNEMSVGSGGAGITYTFTSIDIALSSTGNKNISQSKFTLALRGSGNKFLSDDGTYKYISTSSQSTSVASSTQLGSIKIGYLQNGRNYPVLLDTDNKAYVSVPWTQGTSYPLASQTLDGLMSKEDKTKLDGLTGAYIQIVTKDTYDTMYANGTLDSNTVYHIKG